MFVSKKKMVLDEEMVDQAKRLASMMYISCTPVEPLHPKGRLKATIGKILRPRKSSTNHL